MAAVQAEGDFGADVFEGLGEEVASGEFAGRGVGEREGHFTWMEIRLVCRYEDYKVNSKQNATVYIVVCGDYRGGNEWCGVIDILLSRGLPNKRNT